MIWFTSDNHFGHELMLKHRGAFASVEEMDEAQIRAWQHKVNPGDMVYVLGDFSFHKPEQTNAILRRLPGQKFLIKGNHDHSKDVKKWQGFAWVRDVYKIKKPVQIWLSHYAHRVWPNHQYGAIHLHGHSHGSLPRVGKSMDVGAEIGRYLISLEAVVAIMAQEDTHVVDHHV